MVFVSRGDGRIRMASKEFPQWMLTQSSGCIRTSAMAFVSKGDSRIFLASNHRKKMTQSNACVGTFSVDLAHKAIAAFGWPQQSSSMEFHAKQWLHLSVLDGSCLTDFDTKQLHSHVLNGFLSQGDGTFAIGKLWNTWSYRANYPE